MQSYFQVPARRTSRQLRAKETFLRNYLSNISFHYSYCIIPEIPFNNILAMVPSGEPGLVICGGNGVAIYVGAALADGQADR